MNTTNPAQKSQGSPAYLGPPDAIMFELHKSGFNVLPVGTQRDPKAAAMSFTGKRLNPAQAAAICRKNRSGAYGVRLDDTVVVDFDEDVVGHRDFIRQRFGTPSVQVATARGYHFYYRQCSAFDARAARQIISDAGIAADVKAGPEQYVIGPESQRMDGVVYHPVMGDLARTSLTQIDPLSDINPDKLRQDPDPVFIRGQRHEALKKHAHETVWACQDLPELVDNLRMFADLTFDDRASFTDGEIANLAKWYWDKRMTGALRSGEDCAGWVPHYAVDTLWGNDDAIALLTTLVRHHGRTGRAFKLSHQGMTRAQLTRMGRRRFVTARESLLGAGLLGISAQAQVGVCARSYRLCLGRKVKGEGSSFDMFTASGNTGTFH
jgi:hypothetical protein